MKDIYFEPGYAALYEQAEGGRAMRWSYEGPEGIVDHLFILREIPVVPEDGPWFDLVTPYGYGGPMIRRLAPGTDSRALVAAFEEAFSRFCAEQRVVSEFVRFHPLEDNAQIFAPVYQSQRIRTTVGTNLRAFDRPVEAEFSPGCRKQIRRALARGLTWRVTPRPAALGDFEEIYRSTMERNGAGAYYDFGHRYFDDLLTRFREHILLIEALYEGETAAAGLYFAYGKRLHAHLSGTRPEYLHLSPAYLVQYAGVVWGKEHGYELVHRGGGRTNSPEDSLYRFKKKFGQHTEFDFHVGRRVWDRAVYDRLCALAGGEEGDYFPAYRRQP